MALMSALTWPARFLTRILSRAVNAILGTVYFIGQFLLSWLLGPTPPEPGTPLGRPKIAIIGAGLTGVSSAAHCVGHGFDVVLFEAGPRSCLGGIWTRVNHTSSLQIHSATYRFHPSVFWGSAYPTRSQIVGEVERLWHRYGLENKTRFDTRVEKIYRRRGSWIVDSPEHGTFDGVIACVGTCGDPKMPHLPGQEDYHGPVFHSSQLDGRRLRDKTVLVVGGGSSAVEALEYAAREGARKCVVLSRSEKWIIPRNPVVDVLLSLNIFGSETFLSFVPEKLLRVFFYRELADMAPPPGRSRGEGLFTSTPMVDTAVLSQIRSGRAAWLRGDVVRFRENGIAFKHRTQGVPKNGPGREELVEGDVCVLATGYQRPSLGFLPEGCFEPDYSPPNWYLQTFPPGDPSVCATNCTYANAIGTVGNYHIGIYTRILLMFLVDPLTRPQPALMRAWIDMTCWIKQSAPGGALDFFTYAELLYWFVFVVLFNPFRWKWALFVFTGIGTPLPRKVVQEEDQVRGALGMGQAEWESSLT